MSDLEAVERVRAIAREVVPEAVDGVGYGMPALRYRDKPLLSVVPAKHHIGLYPFSAAVVEAVAPDLGEFSFTKGTIRFTADRPLSQELVRRIVQLRRDEIDAGLGGPPG